MSLKSEILKAVGLPDENIKLTPAFVKVLEKLVEDIAAGGGGGGRGDAILELLASEINDALGVIDIETAKTIVIGMDEALTSNLTFTTTPADGTPLILKYVKGAIPYTANVDTAKFQNSQTSVHPSPLLLATGNTSDTFSYLYDSSKAKMSLTGFDLGA